jgi:hypothetical protein
MMKFTTTETITTNEQLVRLRIYDGEIPLDEAGAELLRLTQAQLDHAHARIRELEAAADRARVA